MSPVTEQKLAEKSIHPTPMRLLVLDYLVQRNAALSLRDIEKGLAPADRITIYRSLKTFEDKGLIHSIDDGTGVPKYALCLDNCGSGRHQDLHLHFFCQVCNETYCLPKTTIPDVILPNKFIANEVNLVVKGLCNRCSS